ncbi:hypothetical protein [Ferrimonas sp. SCSIO 43195]|uniref:hypothetical protein n=1 Tax=Ferrimonas sp. SCSIO 43195 TaxID=2822844 RepID=UPI0020757677|nr:hypothetical protein [Ferrimonas sp. SCSIO 43195]USD38842.1 hypothetical protein J8Z22_06985 [Ferrimonas sp. SCSIO 43195]
MALTIPSIELASGITLTNACLAITQLNTNNTTSLTQTLDDHNQVQETPGGQYTCAFQVGIFASEQAISDQLPPVDLLRDGRTIRVFQLNLNDPEYQQMTPRQAAYQYLQSLQEFSGSSPVIELEA